MAHNKASKIAALKMISKKNYCVESDVLDFVSLVDDSLSFTENFNEILPKVKALSPKWWCK